MANNMKQIMQNVGMSARTLSELSGIALPNMYKMINKPDLSKAYYDTLRTVSLILGVSTDELVGTEDRIFNRLLDQMRIHGVTVDDVLRDTGLEVEKYLSMKDLRTMPLEDLRTLTNYLDLPDERYLFFPATMLDGSKVVRNPK